MVDKGNKDFHRYRRHDVMIPLHVRLCTPRHRPDFITWSAARLTTHARRYIETVDGAVILSAPIAALEERRISH